MTKNNRKAVERKAPAVDMGALQKEVSDAKRDAKAKAAALQRAHDADIAAKGRVVSAVDAFQNASRAVLA